ncbi:MAG: LytTR family DNA-binding domain-containing protein [Vicingaceae bacterium]
MKVKPKIKVFITDDEPKAIQTLERIISLYFDESVEVIGSAFSVEEAYKKLTSVHYPDVLFLDIEMGVESGFDLLEKLNETDIHVAFLTAHEEYALKAIKFSAIDYIIKPANVEDLKTLFSKVNRESGKKQKSQKLKHLFANFLTGDKSEHKITLPTTEGYEFIKVDEVLYLRADGSYTHFTLKDGSRLMSSKNLKFYESILSDYGFFRIHHSTMINIKYIRKYNKTAGGSVIMEDDNEFSISKGKKVDFFRVVALK